ncbi:DoxX family protein [Erwiniaceae bacterium BAC15a-03b]|uniref:DoxX family protein n=1 Tax=Winslowiella arboricola TaxID=2978220 RepID=A0A9J6PZY7_9GAMM|nr:DoxX family protein [Winslowiella arboricola]MCU5775591.1 DoxX family protein [Winslowiella arboricola]MCU5779559.1 DoxX family protein [Winslowiella arboricola]
MFSAINNGFSRMADHPDFGKLLLRLTFGILLLFHGEAKVHNGVGWIANMLTAHGFPGFIAYGAYIGEIVAPVMVIIGLLTRPAAFVIAINLLVATLLVKTGAIWSRTDVGAWALETEALYFFGGVIIMLLGAGKYTLIRNPRLQ